MLRHLPQLINLCATMILMLSFAMISQRRIVSPADIFPVFRELFRKQPK